MAIVVQFDIPGMTTEQGAALLQETGAHTLRPPGLLFVVEGVTDTGTFRSVAVWESEEAFHTFVLTQLAPAAHKLGLVFETDLRPEVWQVSTMLK